ATDPGYRKSETLSLAPTPQVLAVEIKHFPTGVAADCESNFVGSSVAEEPDAAVEERHIHAASVPAAEADQVARVTSRCWSRLGEGGCEGDRGASRNRVAAFGTGGRPKGTPPPPAVTGVPGIVHVSIALADRGGVARAVGDLNDGEGRVLVERAVQPA